MSDMAYYEVLELYTESMKKSIDRCKELSKLTGNKTWAQVAKQLNGLRMKGEEMANARSLSKGEIEVGLDKHAKLWATPDGH